MGKLALQFSCFAVIALAVSCSKEEPVIKADFCTRDWADMRKDSVITVLAENSPATYFIYRGRNMGYEYEILHEFAKDQNIRLQLKMVNDKDTMIHLLQNCEGDIIAANLTITDERRQFVSFSDSYLTTHMVLIQRMPENYRRMKKSNCKIRWLMRSPNCAVRPSMCGKTPLISGKSIT